MTANDNEPQETYLEVELAALKHLEALKQIIDKLKRAGPCLDGQHSLANIRGNLIGLAERTEFHGLATRLLSD